MRPSHGVRYDGLDNGLEVLDHEDYVMESDESRIYSATHLMVASLAGILAHEPLYSSISSQLRNNLQSLNVHIASDLLEHAIQLVTNDNLDLGRALIEHATTKEDFVRFTWQNQSDQNVNVVPLSSLAPPGSVALQRGYSSGLVQLNPVVFSSSLGNSGINVVAHSLNPEDMEQNSIKLLRE
nr:CCR4-Not transcription complex subunit 1 isoform X1 [Tanacetum cinerariifolium]GEZ38777.1 CCR4-Not transcription complex subunit 1 isoform X1 [Tanacetum cinerariifolium]